MIKKGLNPRFAEVGKIKIGGKGKTRKSKDNKEYQLPIRYDHFMVTTNERGQDGNFLVDNDLMSKLGKEPKEIPIRLPFDSIDMNFFTSFQYYHGKKCICQGDGETAKRINNKGIEIGTKCDTDICEFLMDGKCKVSGILSCHIPATMQVGAVHRFRTHSWNSVSNILASLNYLKDNTNGILQGLPLKLIFLKKATQEHGNVNTVTVVLDGIEMMKMREMALAEYKHRTEIGLDMKILETQARDAGFMNDNDDPEDVESEFYAPTIDTDTADPGVSADDVDEKLTEKKETEIPVAQASKDDGTLL